jgi:hypothetical protein
MDQFIAIWGMGSVPADWRLRLKQPPLSKTYLAGVLMVIMVMEVGPYVEELWRTWRCRKFTAAKKQ